MTDTWDGPEIPLEMQALVVAKYFYPALGTLLRQLALLHKEIGDQLSTAETGGEVISTLQDHPFFEFVMAGLVEGHDKFGDDLFRKSVNECGLEAQEEIRDALVYLAVMCWVGHGATFPEGTFDDEDADEEE